MSKIKLTGDSSGYVEISAGDNAGNNTLELPTSGTKVVASDSSNNVNGLGIVTATTFSGALTGDVTGSAINVTGVITATSFSGDGSSLTGIDATSLKDSGGNIKVQANSSGIDITGVATATSFSGALTGTATTATNLADGANITTGTISNDRLPATITKNLTGNVTGTATTATNAEGLTGTPNLSSAVVQNLRGLSGGGVLVCAAKSSASSSGNWPETVDFVIPMGDLTGSYQTTVTGAYSSGETGSTYDYASGGSCLLLASCWNTYYWGYATKLYLCSIYGQVGTQRTIALHQLHSYNAAGHPSSSAAITLSVVGTTSSTSCTPRLRASFTGDYWNSNTVEVIIFGGGIASPACLGPTSLSGLNSNLTGQAAAWT